MTKKKDVSPQISFPEASLDPDSKAGKKEPRRVDKGGMKKQPVGYGPPIPKQNEKHTSEERVRRKYESANPRKPQYRHQGKGLITLRKGAGGCSDEGDGIS